MQNYNPSHLGRIIREQGQASHPNIALYQKLVLNNLSALLTPCFPVIREILSQNQWVDHVKSFLKNAPPQTPLFHELPELFVHYLRNNPDQNLPFLHELAHYEWLELHLELVENDPFPKQLLTFDESTFTLSSCARLVVYQYEVEKISPDFIPEQAHPSYLLIYRNSNFQIKFIKLNELTFYLLESLIQQSIPLQQLLQQVYLTCPDLENTALKEQLKALLNQLAELNILRVNP